MDLYARLLSVSSPLYHIPSFPVYIPVPITNP